jgi:hypothetical protein
MEGRTSAVRTQIDGTDLMAARIAMKTQLVALN